MRHRSKVIIAGNWLTLSKSKNVKTGRVHYSVSADLYYKYLPLHTLGDEVRKHFDPTGCRGSKYGTKWKFRTREEAEQLVTMAILKFGA